MNKHRQKINLKDWKSKNNSVKLETLIAEALIGPTPYNNLNKNFLIKNSTERKQIIKKDNEEKRKELLELIKNFSHKPHPLYPKGNLFEVKATVADFKKLANNKIVGDIYLLYVKNAINLRRIRDKEWAKTKMVSLVKVELVEKGRKNISKYRHTEIWIVKNNSYKNLRNKIQKHFNQYYSNDFTGKIIDYTIDDMDNIQSFVKNGGVISLWEQNYKIIDKTALKENRFWNLSLTL